MQREVPDADVPLYSCPPRIHLEPSFIGDHIETVLLEQGYKGDVKAAAGRIVAKCQKACERS